MTLIICSECGGHFFSAAYKNGLAVLAACDDCGKDVSADDITLEAGEVLMWDARGRLGYEVAA